MAVALLGVAIAPDSTAGQLITYKGHTSEDDPVWLYVVKKDSGRRILRLFVARRFTLTCEDSSTHGYSLTVNLFSNLGTDGTFQVEHDPGGVRPWAFSIDGTVKFARGEGTFRFDAAGLDDEGSAQLCTSGDLEWTVERVHQARTSSAGPG